MSRPSFRCFGSLIYVFFGENGMPIFGDNTGLATSAIQLYTRLEVT